MAAPISFGIRVTDLTVLSRDLRSVSSDLSRGLTAVVKAAATPVLTQARTNASFSARIPGSIRLTSTAGRARTSVKIVAGGRKAPEAAPFENKGLPGTFRHPVFGNRDVWVDQRAHPFLLPALVSTASNVEAAVGAAIDGYLSAHGL